MSDLISREDLIKSIDFDVPLNQYERDTLNLVLKRIKALPPVEPQGISKAYKEVRELRDTCDLSCINTLNTVLKILERNMVEQTEWISVKDRLPELGQMVLVTYVDGDVETNERMTLKNLEVWKYGNSVVAWMPLPSPYKGE